jgi:hypothetical protein
MLNKILIRKSITLMTIVAVWCVFSMSVVAAPDDVMGEITISGQVTVNGQSVASNSTVTSGSTIVTGTNSTAIISLGKNGRVEVLADSSVTLKFTGNSIVGMLTAGKVLVSNSAGIATTVTTRNATVIADAGQADNFSVDVGCSDEARCTQTHVETFAGLVTLRSGSTDKQVAAGTNATYGNPSQTGCKPCMRPGGAPPVAVAGLGAGAIAAILLAAAGAVGAAIFLRRRGGGIDIDGGGTNIISPTR